MTADLAGVHIKLARADSHIKELDELIRPEIHAATSSIVSELSSERTKLVYKIERTPRIDPGWSRIVGDALFNLRSAFDHLAWQLVCLDGGVPSEHTQFPVYDSRLNAKRNPRSVTIRPQINRPDILTALDDVQPYQRHDLNMWLDSLWLVHHLNRIDKHRLLLAVAGVLNIDDHPPIWTLDKGVPSPNTWFNYGVALKDGDPIARFDFGEYEAPDNFKPGIALSVILNEGPADGWLRYQDVVSVLRGLRGLLTQRLNEHFVPLFQNEMYFVPSTAIPSTFVAWSIK
jgi:hypothetical protein